MNTRSSCEDTEVLLERLMRVENALFCLKAKAKCFPIWDNSEIERLERLRSELRARCEEMAQRGEMVAG